MSKNNLMVKRTSSNLPSLSISLKVEAQKRKINTEIKEIRPRETQALLDEVMLRSKEGTLWSK